MIESKRRKEAGISEDYLYEKNTRAVTYKDFVNKELVLFSNMDNERSIASSVDGLKPGSRKVFIYIYIILNYVSTYIHCIVIVYNLLTSFVNFYRFCLLV